MTRAQLFKGKTQVTCLIVIIILLLVTIILIILFSGYFLLRKTHTIPSTDAFLINEAITSNSDYATIEGSLGYPSDYIPPTAVCALNKKTTEEFCTYEMIELPSYTYGFGYHLNVPPGTYHVYAFITEYDDGTQVPEDDIYKAYYSQYVTCMQSENVECDSHKPLDVVVEKNQAVTNIDPQDWYNF